MQREENNDFSNVNNNVNNNTNTNEVNNKEQSPKSLIPFNLNRKRVFPERLPPLKRKTKSSKSTKSKIINEGFEISWKNLSYIVESPIFGCLNISKCNDNKRIRVILKCLSGNFKSGELTAVMGPSGAGKSTLLGCVCGNKTVGVSGEIKIIGSNGIKASIIAQDDYLLDKFTVKESLIFASKVKNGIRKVNHDAIINNVVNILNLESCLNTRCGKCSGGQRKRISIALELVSKPNILILDEPTSGLDSSSCLQTIKTLKDLTQQKEPIAVVATIHQPSVRVFNMFNKVYVISNNGQCIFNGSPEELPRNLSDIGMECPNFHSPADYILEIASGEYGNEPIAKLATKRKESMPINEPSQSQNLSDLIQKKSYPLFVHTWLLFIRSLKIIPREPHLSSLRITTNIINAIVFGLLFGNDIGRVTGCPPTQKRLYESNVEELLKDFERDTIKLRENFGLLFFTTVFLMYGGLMPMVLVFPQEVNVFLKEYTNGWYSITTYYISKTLADLPFQILFPTVFISIVYYMTGQEKDLWRYAMIVILSIGISVIGQSQGIMMSALFSDNMVQAAFMGAMSTIPCIIFSGFFVRYVTMPWYLKPLSYISYLRFVFESYLISLYGFNRCPNNINNSSIPDPPWFKWIKLIDFHQNHVNEDDYSYKSEYQYDDEDSNDNAVKKIIALFSGPYVDPQKMDQSQSLVMSQFDLNDKMLYDHLISLAVYIIIVKLIAYFILYWKASHKN